MLTSLLRRTSMPVLVVLLAASSVALSGCFSMNRATRGGGGGGGGQTELVMINNTQTPIYYVYVSSCQSSQWGPDQLGSNVVMPGNSWTFRMAPGCYDLKAVDRDGREAEERNVRISGSGKRWTLS